MNPFAAYLVSQAILDQRRRDGDRARLAKKAAANPKRNGRRRSASSEEVSDVSRAL